MEGLQPRLKATVVGSRKVEATKIQKFLAKSE
jgi:hypothetical protein